MRSRIGRHAVSALAAAFVLLLIPSAASAESADVTIVDSVFEYDATQGFPCGSEGLPYGELVDWHYEVRIQYRGVVDPNGGRHVTNPVFTTATGIGQTSGDTYHLNWVRTFNVTQSSNIFNNLVSGHETIVGPGGNHYKADLVIHWISTPGEGEPTGVQVNMEGCSSN